jgi:hypothetical protein
MPKATTFKIEYFFPPKNHPYEKNDRGLRIHISHMEKSIKNKICGHVERNNEIA